MKKASRFMPLYKPKKSGLLGHVVLIGFVLVLLCGVVAIAAQSQTSFILTVTAILSLLFLIKLEQQKSNRHFLHLANTRKDLSICDFAREFDTTLVDTWVIRAVYEQLQAALPKEHTIPIKATDHLLDTLLLDEDDIGLDIVEEIAQRTGRSLEGYQGNPYYGEVTTVKNLVLFFNNQQKLSAS